MQQAITALWMLWTIPMLPLATSSKKGFLIWTLVFLMLTVMMKTFVN